MKRLNLALLTALVLPSLALAYGEDYPPGPVSGNDWWPKGMKNLVNREDRIHGYCVNMEQILFYAGDTKALNDFLDSYSKLNDTKLVVTLHPGKMEARSPWDTKGQGKKADWCLYFTQRDWIIGDDPGKKIKRTDPTTISQLDVSIGGKVSLKDLRVPPKVVLESGSKSNKEIDEFIRKNPR